MGKFRVKKWYQEYYGYHDIEAADQDQALQIERDVLHDEGLDPNDFHIEAEPIEEALPNG